MRSLSPDQQFHLTIFTLCLAVTVASVVLTPGDAAVSLFGWEIPKLCLWSRVTGTSCMGCGLTRSFTYMGHGDLAMAFHYHKLGPPFWAFVVGLVPWHGVKLARSFRRPLPV